MYGVAEWFAQKKPKNVTMRLLWRMTNICEVFALSMVVTACCETDLDTEETRKFRPCSSCTLNVRRYKIFSTEDAVDHTKYSLV